MTTPTPDAVRENMKNGILAVLVFVGACIAVSLSMSVFRISITSGDREIYKCDKLNFDRLEPLLSTRWFCKVETK